MRKTKVTKIREDVKLAKVSELRIEKSFDEKVAELMEMYPDVPPEIYDIEPSIEMAEMFESEMIYGFPTPYDELDHAENSYYTEIAEGVFLSDDKDFGYIEGNENRIEIAHSYFGKDLNILKEDTNEIVFSINNYWKFIDDRHQKIMEVSK